MRDEDLFKMAGRLAGATVRTAGRIEFVRDQGPLRRDIRVNGFKWDPDIHRNLAKTLWAVERAHSYGMAALRLFSKMNSSEFSPDGLLGGKGYIQQVKDLRSHLSQAVEVMSSFSDTLHDEVNADHWRSAMEQDPVSSELVEQAETVKAHPEQFVEQSYQDEVPVESMNPSPDDFNPFSQEDEDKDDDEDGIWSWDALSRTSSLMEDGDPQDSSSASNLPKDESDQKFGLSDAEAVMNTTGESPRGNYAAAIRQAIDFFGNRTAAFKRNGEPRLADSSIDPSGLPSPRIMHIGPGESPEEFGYGTDAGDRPSDDPAGEGFSHLDPIYEGQDANADGVTGYAEPTDGAVTVFRGSAERLARTGGTYSWLPGSGNEKLMPYYDRGLTDEDVNWMRANSQPDPPAGLMPKPVKPPSDPLWDIRRSQDGQPSSD